MGNWNQISVQILGNRAHDHILSALQAGPVSTVKLVEADQGTYEKVRAWLPDTTIILREVENSWSWQNMDERKGRLWAESLLSEYHYAQPDDDKVWFQAANEVTNGNSPTKTAPVGRFDFGFSQVMHEAGFKVVGTAPSTGTPEVFVDGEAPKGIWLAPWLAYLDIAARPGGIDAIGINEYARQGQYEYNWSWEWGRYLAWVRPNLPAAYAKLPVLVAECGFEPAWTDRVPISDYLWMVERLMSTAPSDFAFSLYAVSQGDPTWDSYKVEPLLPHLQGRWAASPPVSWPPKSDTPDPDPDPDPEPPPLDMEAIVRAVEAYRNAEAESLKALDELVRVLDG